MTNLATEAGRWVFCVWTGNFMTYNCFGDKRAETKVNKLLVFSLMSETSPQV